MQTSERIHRRPLLKAFAGGVTALGAVAGGARVFLHEDDEVAPEQGAITLISHGSGGVRAIDVELGEKMLPRVAAGEWRSRQLPTSTHSMVAFTWPDGEQDPDIVVKSRVDGAWTAWQPVRKMHDVPDRDSEEWSGTVGTELVWIGAADGIEVRLRGSRPKGLTLVLLHPARELLPARFRAGASLRGGRHKRVPRPDLRSRAQWGADESWRDGAPTYNDTIRQVHVHHTVNSNSYSRRDVPGLIRGMYRYHTYNLGWSDIGYNFLVDRFGRIWAGRAGGVNRAVRGAHTLGFNATSTGVACIGNFETARPTKEMVRAVAAVAAWKLDRYGGRPRGRVQVRSEGSDRYRAGQVVELPVIDGHRDTNGTACPGRHVYDALPSIRRRAKARIDRYHSEQPAIRVETVGRTDRAVIKVRVQPPAGTRRDATGTVVVQVNKRSKRRRLDDGGVVVRFGRKAPLRPGRYPVQVRYLGNKSLSAASASTTVVVG